MERLSSGTITMLAEMYLACLPFKDYLTCQVLGMHTTMLRRFLRHIIQLTNSMDSTFLRSNELDKSIYGQSYPFLLPFCLTFLHIVDRSPGKCSLGFSCLQSVIGNEVLSNGSAHLGSPSDRQTQHLMDSPAHFIGRLNLIRVYASFWNMIKCCVTKSTKLLMISCRYIILCSQVGIKSRILNWVEALLNFAYIAS